MPNAPNIRRAPNGVFYVHWTAPSPIKGKPGRSKRKTLGTADLATAQRKFGQFLLLDDDQPTAPTEQKHTVADLWGVYDEKRVEKVVAPAAIRSAWKNLEPHFGSLTPAQVTDDATEAYERKRALGRIGRPAQQSTVRRELIVLRACFNWCAKRKIIARADVPNFELPPDSDPRDRWLTHDEVQKLMETAAALRRQYGVGDRLSRAERFLWLALETAARKTAICQLTWDRVDRETNVIDYNVPGRRRTKKRRGVVPISKALAPILDRIRAERLPDGNLVMDTPHDVWETISTVARRAGVPGVSPHILRHTAATHMARRGVPMFKIAKILAITVATAERVYAKHAPGDLRDAVDAISGGVLAVAEEWQERQLRDEPRKAARLEEERDLFLAQLLRPFAEMQWIDHVLALLDTTALQDGVLTARYQAFARWASSRRQHLQQVTSAEQLQAMIEKSNLFDGPNLLPSTSG